MRFLKKGFKSNGIEEKSSTTDPSGRTHQSDIPGVGGEGEHLLSGKNNEENGEEEEATATKERFLKFFKRKGEEKETKEEDEEEEEEETRGGYTFNRSKSLRTGGIDFLKDNKCEMTYSRIIALNLMQYKWYFPGALSEDEKVKRSFRKSMGLDKDCCYEEEIESRPPKITSKKTPSLEKAWSYFEHFALSRHLIDKEDGTYDKYDLKAAEPGESDTPTKMYHPIYTPQSQMGDFGLGVGLYFATLRSIAVLTLLAGLMNIYNIVYFSSSKYSNGQEILNTGSTDVLLKGSAICTETEWVHCPDCGDAENRNGFSINRWVETTMIGNRTTYFALRNTCDDGATFDLGMVNFGTLLLLFVGIIVLNFYLQQQEVKFDEDEQTAEDYSIRITNPPDDARDPEEWREYFYENFHGAHATVVTVALDNDPLIRALRERRECMYLIELEMEPGTSLDVTTISRIAAEIEYKRKFLGKVWALIFPGIPERFGRIAELEAKICGLAQQDYPCSNIFVTFETEEDQRDVLSALSIGSYHKRKMMMNGDNGDESEDNRESEDGSTGEDNDDDKQHDCLPPLPLFRNEIALQVETADEPNTIRWADLNLKMKDILKPLATSSIFSMLMIVLIVFLIIVIKNWVSAYAAIAIALFNAIFPAIAKVLTGLERHASESSIESSLYFKIALFRWTTTAITMTIITPFTETLENDGLINTISAIFIAEIATTNILQLLDIGGFINRHILAPRAKTQDAMNLRMQGTEVSLAERYTNMTKILFLAMWYSSIYPMALFLCAFALFINYYTDKFSLMRTWKRFPHLGTSISACSRRYFFTTTLLVMATVSAYFWSGFPFDNLCEISEEEEDNTMQSLLFIDNDNNNHDNIFDHHHPTTNTTNITATLQNGTSLQIELRRSNITYRYCNQDLLKGNGNARIVSFPALSIWQPEGNEWMSTDQERLVNIYGWTSIGFLGAVILYFLVMFLFCVFSRIFRKGGISERGESQGIRFSEVQSISAYIPQVSSTVFAFPLLACKCDSIDDPDLYDWIDPDRPHSYYDLTKDADEIVGEGAINYDMNFSIISHVPYPEGKEKS